MRRRLLDCGRMKRPPTKRTRLPETGQANSYLHWKLLAGWLVVILLDMMTDCRFEYLYPAYMFFRSVYDSYRYQGLVFALLFVYLVMYCNLLWLSLLSGPLLFVAASACVWLEIVRNVDHVFSYSALTLWLLFIYVEISYRFQDLPQHYIFLDLSRPFAAHCIGYPVVTMSFLIKHQITHIIRQRQRKKVVEENSLYFGVLQKALPPEELPEDQSTISDDTPLSLPNSNHSNSHHSNSDKPNKPSPKSATTGTKQGQRSQSSSSGKHRSSNNVKNSSHKLLDSSNSSVSAGAVVANGDLPSGRPLSAGKVHLPSGKKQATVKAVPREDQPLAPPVQDKAKNTVEILQTELKHERQARAEAEVTISRLELDIKKLKADLHASCLQEEETSSQVGHLLSSEKGHKHELQRLRTESESLQNKLSKLSSNKHHDQSSIAELEKRLKEESVERVRAEAELRDHKHATQNSWSDEEVKELKGKLSSKDKEIDSLHKDLRKKEKMLDDLSKDLVGKRNSLRAYDEEKKQLKASLADETRVKIELFTALSDARRKHQGLMEECQRKSVEINRLRQNLAEIMAIIPSPPTSTVASLSGYPPSPPAGSPQH